jgi:hypothetical protein
MSDRTVRIPAYLAVIIVIAALSVWLGGGTVERKNLVAGLILAPIAAALVWLRWDDAPAQAARRNAEGDPLE